MVMYINFQSFKKIQISAQNPMVLAFSFNKKCQFVIKNDQNSIFLGHEANILDRLYIMVKYIKFYVFKKNQISAQNPKLLPIGFTEKCQFVAKND
jgi:hypothetical protein